MGNIIQTLNGKKLPIALTLFIITTGIGYGELKSSVKNNTKVIDELKQTPIQMARIEEQVNGIDENMEKQEQRQEKRFDRMNAKLDRLLEAVR